jgi:DNA-directed RNA polymerase subunit H (RpoH/RPB5)
MNAEVFEVLYRSRKTLLTILKNKGYDTGPYEKFGPWEIEAMIQNEKKNSLRMDLMKKDSVKSDIQRCIVVYRLNRLKQSIQSFISAFFDEESEEYVSNPESTEVIVMLLEPVNNVDVFHNAALNVFQNKLRLNFFQAHSLVNNPQEHVLVPIHELVDKDEIPNLKKKLNIQSISNLPFIRYHQDIQSRILGAVPGDVLKITRPSASAGVETIYRVCVP